MTTGGRDPEPDEGERGRSTIDEAPNQILEQIGELLEYLSYYLDIKVDSAKARSRTFLFHCALELLFLLMTAALAIGGITLFSIGVAAGFREIFAGKPWLGNMVAGVVLVGCSVGGWHLRFLMLRKAVLERTVQRYEQRKRQQQSRFGHSVTDQAKANPSDKRS